MTIAIPEELVPLLRDGLHFDLHGQLEEAGGLIKQPHGHQCRGRRLFSARRARGRYSMSWAGSTPSRRPCARWSAGVSSGSRSSVGGVRLRKPTPPLVDPNWPPLGAPNELDEEEARESTPPTREAIEWHLTYFVEAYLPSHAERLADTLTTLGWTITRWEPNPDLVPSLREGRYGGAWTPLKLLVPEGAPLGFSLGERLASPLPDGVSSIALRLCSVTPSLTMLVAACEWDEYWGDALDRILRTDYNRGWLPMPGNARAWSGSASRKRIEIRRRRREMHRRLASWLTERLPGAFQDLGKQHPALDVISAAGFRPYLDEDDAFAINSYRRLLSLTDRYMIGTSPDLPGLCLALPERDEPPVLTLAGRTADVFDDRRLDKYGGEVSRWGLRNFLRERAEGLVVSWATVSLLDAMRVYLASFRDRAPEAGESPAQFAKRLSNDVPNALRRGSDAGTLCADIQRQPATFGPIFTLHYLTTTLSDALGRTTPLRTRWSEMIYEEASRVAESEVDQRERLATNVNILGLRENLRTQRRLLLLTVALAVFAAFTIALGILQVRSSQRAITVRSTTNAVAPVPR